MRETFLFGVLVAAYLMVIAKRVPALVRDFRIQSFFLFLMTASAARAQGPVDLYLVAFLILLLKVFAIPYFLVLIAKKISVDENLGLFVNAQLSLAAALALSYGSWVFARSLGFGPDLRGAAVAVALAVVFIGAFLMISRMKAFTQVVGLLVMENGIFLFGSVLSGGMPFFVEIAIFFDVLVSALIMGLFVYRINRLFTHIDVSKLSRLKG
ncbi:MAG: hydrogenase [Deltaproteobacteria bacterium]